MISLIVNNELVETSCSPGLVLLDFIRREMKLGGTKEGCKEGECGACTVLIGELKNDELQYKACASCLIPVGALHGKHVVTVEGVNIEGLNAVQQAIFDNSASQCGFCTAGFVLSLTGFLLTSRKFDFEDAMDALDGNLCRCTGYASIRRAAKMLSETFRNRNQSSPSRIASLVDWKVLPEYFLTIHERLGLIKKAPSAFKLKKDTVPVAGGTDLFVQKPDDLLDSGIAFLTDIETINDISTDCGSVLAGGGVTVEEFRQSDVVGRHFPSMNKDLLLVSSMIMRNRATLAGNIVNASPIGDMSIILLALDASLILAKNGRSREMKLSGFFKGYKKTGLKPGEIITGIRIPLQQENSRYSFEKVSNRKILDIASVNSAMYIEAEKGRIGRVAISAGGVAPVPLLLKKTIKFLTGKEITTETVGKAADIAEGEVSPIDDIRGSAQYKRLLLKQLVKTHFFKLFPELTFNPVETKPTNISQRH